ADGLGGVEGVVKIEVRDFAPRAAPWSLTYWKYEFAPRATAAYATSSPLKGTVAPSRIESLVTPGSPALPASATGSPTASTAGTRMRARRRNARIILSTCRPRQRRG